MRRTKSSRRMTQSNSHWYCQSGGATAICIPRWRAKRMANTPDGKSTQGRTRHTETANCQVRSRQQWSRSQPLLPPPPCTSRTSRPTSSQSQTCPPNQMSCSKSMILTRAVCTWDRQRAADLSRRSSGPIRRRKRMTGKRVKKRRPLTRAKYSSVSPSARKRPVATTSTCIWAKETTPRGYANFTHSPHWTRSTATATCPCGHTKTIQKKASRASVPVSVGSCTATAETPTAARTSTPDASEGWNLPSACCGRTPVWTRSSAMNGVTCPLVLTTAMRSSTVMTNAGCHSTAMGSSIRIIAMSPTLPPYTSARHCVGRTKSASTSPTTGPTKSAVFLRKLRGTPVGRQNPRSPAPKTATAGSARGCRSGGRTPNTTRCRCSSST
mmetsp:Transcript_52817/g.132730  ORF Transcript_52817/g.132730 Transcript_52817/m.132730 type:complete len:383 (+) Transcript_52817:1844-2992(+)